MEAGRGQAADGKTLGCRLWVKRKGAGDSTFYGFWEKQPREVPVEDNMSDTPNIQVVGKGTLIEPKPTTNVVK
jgi:hypothetical protein